jgi:thiamine pyrophosphate-dependent acetolactate synthase large subunit-like protein
LTRAHRAGSCKSDFSALACVCGGQVFKAARPEELHGAVREAFACDGPVISDTVVPANELPNMPHLDLNVVGHFRSLVTGPSVATISPNTMRRT